MIRVLSLVCAIALAGCATTPTVTTTTGPGAVAGTTVLVTQVEGAPAALTANFTTAYANAVSARGYSLVTAAAGYTFRTYLSVVGSTAGTLLIYVTDVTDAIGVRVTRISGQANSPQVANDPWRVAADGLIGQAVMRTLDQFDAYLAGNAPGV